MLFWGSMNFSLERLIIAIRSYSARLLALFFILVLILTLFPFSFNPKNNVTFRSDSGVHFSPPSTMYTESYPALFSRMNRFTLLFRLIPEMEPSVLPRKIITNSINSYEQNFCVQQIGTTLYFRVSNGVAGESYNIYVENAFPKGKDTWCCIVYDGEGLTAFIDGVKKYDRKIGRIDFSSWNNAYPLVIGSEANGYHMWVGTMVTISFFDEALHDTLLHDPENLIRSKNPSLLFQFGKVNNGSIRSKGSDSVTTLNIPEYFIPYKRNFLMESTMPFWTRRIYFRDVILNVIMFLPIGYLFSVLFSRRNLKSFLLVILTIVSGFLFSLSIELLQAYLPERNSSITDVFSNVLGTISGYLIFRYVSKKGKSGIEINP